MTQMTDSKEQTTKIKEAEKGFTIIELLVCAAVIFLLLGFAFAGYARLNQRQILISSGLTMKNIIRDVQSKAYNGELDCGADRCDCSPTSSSSLRGWYVDFDSRQIYGECVSSVLPNPPITFSPRPFSLSAEINVTPYITPPATKIMFRYHPPGVDKSAVICLSNKNLDPLSSFYAIQVTEAGEISDSEKEQCP